VAGGVAATGFDLVSSLSEAGIDYVELPLPHTIRSKALGAIAKAQTVPQVFVGGRLIGGSEELAAYLAQQTDIVGGLLDGLGLRKDQ